jgi:hypothetical protein
MIGPILQCPSRGDVPKAHSASATTTHAVFLVAIRVSPGVLAPSANQAWPDLWLQTFSTAVIIHGDSWFSKRLSLDLRVRFRSKPKCLLDTSSSRAYATWSIRSLPAGLRAKVPTKRSR